MNHRGDCLTEITFVREVLLFHLPLTVHQLCITSVRIHLPCSVTRDNPHQQGLSKSWCTAQSPEKKTLTQLNHHWTSPYLWKKCAATFSSIHFDNIISLYIYNIIYIYISFVWISSKTFEEPGVYMWHGQGTKTTDASIFLSWGGGSIGGWLGWCWLVFDSRFRGPKKISIWVKFWSLNWKKEMYFQGVPVQGTFSLKDLD